MQTDSGLLKSLSVLYPSGQLPAIRVDQAAKERLQNPVALLLTAGASSRIAAQGTAKISPEAVAADYAPVQRIQNTSLYGAYFFSIYLSEVTTAIAANPNWRLEGPAFWTSKATGTDIYPVHRFRNKLNGSYLYSIYEAERADIASNYAATFEYEGVAWFARQTQSDGWIPLYRFRNLTNNTYLFTAYESEKDAIVAGYSAVFKLEGIAYYVRQNAQPDLVVVPPIILPVITTITPVSPATATLGAATTFTVVGTNLPLTATITVQGATCQAATSNTATGFSQVCTLGGTAGVKTISVLAATGGTVLDATRSITAALASFVYKLPDTGITSSQCYGAGSNVLISCSSAAAIALNPAQDGMLGLDVAEPAAADGKLGFSYSNVPNPAGGSFATTECVKDNRTGLMWEGKPTTGLRAAANTYTNFDSTTELQKWNNRFYSAPTQAEIDATSNIIGFRDAVNTSALCGFSDWRVPTADELDSLVDAGIAYPGPTIDSLWFPNTVANAFWPASRIGTFNALVVDFGNGGVYGGLRYNALPVRLVRASQ